DEDWLELVLDDINTELADTVWADAPVIPVSSYTGEGIDTLRNTIFELVEETAGKNTQKPFRLPVDRVFSMQGFGTVVTGTLIEGTMKEGQEITIYPEGIRTKIRNLQVHSAPVEEAYAGQRVAVNLLKVKKEEIGRGAVLAEPDSMHTTMMLDVSLQVLADSERTIKNGSRLHFYHGAEEVLCKAVLLGGVEELFPGQECYAQLRFEEPVACKANDHYVVRFYSPIETIGGGTILDPCPYKHKRNSEEALRRLEMLHHGGWDERLETIVLEHSPHFVNKEHILLQTTLSPEEFAETLDRLKEDGRIIAVTDKIFLHRDYIAQQAEKVRTFLAEYHKENPLKLGARREDVRGKLYRHIDAPLAEKLLALIEVTGAIEIVNGCCRIPDFRVVFTKKQEDLRKTLLERYQASGFAPPEKSALQAEFGRDKDFPKVLDHLLDEGDIIPVDSELFFPKENMEQAMGFFRDLHEKNGSVTLAEFRDAIGTSRKYAMAILDCWDKRGITQKNGDARTFMK
ncbi:MAG: SelB C-terminal domain-containing protein, partial [Clostridia bacterium]|nr:SelB C-terminal domain-containing protein [Clostridia bacterium]